jgi:hypothetical protein
MSAALGVVLVTFGAIAFGFAAVWLGRRAYRAPRLPAVLCSGLLAGGAVFGIVVVVSALRHFGGRVTITDGGTGGYACAQWWAQLDSFNGVTNDHVTTSPDCRRAAIDAVGSALLQSALLAAAAAVLVGGFLAIRMRSSHPV